LPFPNAVHAHDYYISLVNEVIGRRVYIEKPLMLYRQHEDNLVGGKKNTRKKKSDNIKYFSIRKNIIPKNRLRTIKEFSRTYSDLPLDIKKDIDDIIMFSESNNFLTRVKKLHLFSYWVKFSFFHFIKDSLILMLRR
jgi:rhamnosyltransferase